MSARPGRNEPCHCGSGRKFKFCHGAVVVVALAVPAAPQRQCGTCTACCEGWAEGEIRGHWMSPGRHCHFLEGGSGGACSIYDERPQSPCRNFVCGWLRPGSAFPDEFRPDRCGVIIVPTRWRDHPAYILLSAGHDPAPEMLAWMKAYANETRSPFFYALAGERIGYGPPEFQQEMLARLAQGQRLW